MKKLLFSALLAVSIASSAFAASTNKVSSTVLNNFQVEFKNASEVSWTPGGEYTKAAFTVNNERMEAFYNSNGEMIGTSKAVSIDQIAENAKRTFDKKFEGYSVTEVIRFEGVDETAYYISAENEKEAVIIKIDENNQLSTFKKTKK